MTQNQANKELEKLRVKIDEIDDKIIKLLNDRMEIVDEVGKLKENNGEKFFVRSAREADMIRDLIAKNSGKFPNKDIVNIWRKIIAAANCFEQNLKIALCNPANIPDYKYLIKSYYNDEIEIVNFTSATSAIASLEQNKTQIAIFALPNDLDEAKDWWIALANNQVGLKIYTQIPFLGNGEFRLVACGIKEAEPSQKDSSLAVVEINRQYSKSSLIKALEESNIEAKILKETKLAQIDDAIFYLLEINGFAQESDEKIQNFTANQIKPYVKIIGHIAC